MKNLFKMSFVVFNDKTKLSFYESILSKLVPNSLTSFIKIRQLSDGNVNISKGEALSEGAVPIMRPSFCPIAALEMKGSEPGPSSMVDKGVAVACTIFVQNNKGEILLTKRATNLRSFPNVWVPPGGHVDAQENLETAALRELAEETGLTLSSKDFNLQLICAWESVFPTSIELGMPRSHHLVLYYVATLNTEFIDLDKLAISINEVSAFTWLNKRQIAEIVRSFTDCIDFSLISNIVPLVEDELFRCIEVELKDDKLQYKEVMRPLSVLTAPVINVTDFVNHTERVSTGTKYALYQWLIMNSVI